MKKFKFENIYEIGDYSIDNYPLYLNSDGCVLIVKDKTKFVREPTSDEFLFYCRPKRESFKKTLANCNSNGSCSTNESDNQPFSYSKKASNYKKDKDKGIVITVKKTDSDIKEE